MYEIPVIHYALEPEPGEAAHSLCGRQMVHGDHYERSAFAFHNCRPCALALDAAVALAQFEAPISADRGETAAAVAKQARMTPDEAMTALSLLTGSDSPALHNPRFLESIVQMAHASQRRAVHQ